MKTLLLFAIFNFSSIISGKLLIPISDNCTDWESFVLADGTKSNLFLRFCSLSEYSKNSFEVKNDNNLDAKLICKINFKNGQKATYEVIIHHNGKTKVDFGTDESNYQSGISTWQFDQIKYGECGSFNVSTQKN